MARQCVRCLAGRKALSTLLKRIVPHGYFNRQYKDVRSIASRPKDSAQAVASHHDVAAGRVNGSARRHPSSS